MLAIDDSVVGQHVPGTGCTKVVLMFSEHVKTVGKEGSLTRFAWAFKSPSKRQLKELDHLGHSQGSKPAGRKRSKTSLS